MPSVWRSVLCGAGGGVYGAALTLAVFLLWQEGRPGLAALVLVVGLAAIAAWGAWYTSWGHVAAVVRRRHERERRRAHERALDVSRL